MVTQLSILEQYAQDCLEFDTKYCEDKSAMYKTYATWCLEKGYEPVNDLAFKRQFLKMMEPLINANIHNVVSDVTRIGHKRIHLYRGVRLKQPA